MEMKHILIEPDVHEILKEKSKESGMKIQAIATKILKENLSKKEE